MNIRLSLQIVALGLLVLIVVSVATAFAAGIDVSSGNVGKESLPVTPNDIKPSSCAALNLTTLVTGAGTLTGTTGNDLIIGGSSIDSIDGLGGNDCILAGGGDDTLIGGDDNDVCLGGPGIDTFSTCEGEVQ
ncbi:MAG: hypothetical protein AB1649_03565 [Chloroflexota bacterium]